MLNINYIKCNYIVYFRVGCQVVCSAEHTVELNKEHDQCPNSLGPEYLQEALKMPFPNCMVISLVMCKVCLAGYGYSSTSSEPVKPHWSMKLAEGMTADHAGLNLITALQWGKIETDKGFHWPVPWKTRHKCHYHVGMQIRGAGGRHIPNARAVTGNATAQWSRELKGA